MHKHKLQLQQQQQQVAAAVAAAQGQQAAGAQQAPQGQTAQTTQANPQLAAVAAPRPGAVLTGATVANLQVARMVRWCRLMWETIKDFLHQVPHNMNKKTSFL